MIRYSIDPLELQANIKKEDANWFTKAKKRTEKFVEMGLFGEKSSIWSKAKPAFMVLQSNKCAFCERPFSGPHESRIDMDLEHFRPKSAISAWTPPPGAKPYPAESGGASPNGYFWLAYSTTNYLAPLIHDGRDLGRRAWRKALI